MKNDTDLPSSTHRVAPITPNRRYRSWNDRAARAPMRYGRFEGDSCDERSTAKERARVDTGRPCRSCWSQRTLRGSDRALAGVHDGHRAWACGRRIERGCRRVGEAVPRRSDRRNRASFVDQFVVCISFGITTYSNVTAIVNQLAEGAGFEPAIRFPVYTLSRRAPSTARPPLLVARQMQDEGEALSTGRGANARSARAPVAAH
jgi:hypothetical protein